jgi:hypothetical protein
MKHNEAQKVSRAGRNQHGFLRPDSVTIEGRLRSSGRDRGTDIPPRDWARQLSFKRYKNASYIPLSVKSAVLYRLYLNVLKGIFKPINLNYCFQSVTIYRYDRNTIQNARRIAGRPGRTHAQAVRSQDLAMPILPQASVLTAPVAKPRNVTLSALPSTSTENLDTRDSLMAPAIPARMWR